jgi:uncharacterized glyoxalase superfamily protein PhnB
VDPHIAFTAFTEEMDLWWVRGPINFYDSSRAVAVRCEPGVGGRLLEVYDDARGDWLELGRITIWEPGVRIAWQSSTDDVQIEVRFEPISTGTVVRVVATVPADGKDRGGSSWVRVVPPWFGAWCSNRDTAIRPARDLSRLAIAVYYAQPEAGARWLATVFGLQSPSPLPDDGEGSGWIEFHVGNCSVMVFKLEGEVPDNRAITHMPWLFVDDLEGHFAHTQASGGRIVEGIRKHGYRAYVAADLEGHQWTIAQARPTMG